MSNLPPFTLTQLRYFIEVAETGNIAHSASRLFVSASAVSTSISNLEKALSVQLFIRTHSKGVTLTNDGANFLIAAKSLINHAIEVSSLSQEMSGSLSGKITVGCFSFVAPFFLPAVLYELKERFPDITILLREDNLANIQGALIEGMCDVACLYNLNMPERIHTDVLSKYSPYALLPESHILAKNEKVSLTDLQSEPMVLVDLPHSRDYMERIAQQAKINFNISYQTGSYEMVRSLVANGLGFSILNQRSSELFSYDGKPLVVRELEEDVPSLDLVLATLSGVRLSRRVAAFCEVCKAYFSAKRLRLRRKR